MHWSRAGKVSQASGVEASPTVFREESVTAWRSTYAQGDLADLRLECPEPTEGAVTFAYEGSDVRGSAACSAFQKYDARRTGVYFRRKGETGYSDTLSVGKWENAFDLFLGSARVKDDFLSHEGDTFRLVCFDEAQPDLPEVSVALKSFDVGGMLYLANETLRLTRTSPGRFESDDLLMVADNDDATFGRTRFPEGARLFRGRLCGEVRAEYSGVSRTVDVGAGIKTLHVTVVVPTTGGLPITENIGSIMQAANERFAQANVHVQVDSVNQIEQPTGVNLLDGLELGHYTHDLQGGTTNLVFNVSNEAQKLLEAFGTPADPNDVRIIFVPYIIPVEDIVTGDLFAYSGIALAEILNPQYGNTIIIRRNYSEIDLAHEIGHLLLNSNVEDHDSAPWNLMHQYPSGLGVTRNKRLKSVQSERIRGNRLL